MSTYTASSVLVHWTRKSDGKWSARFFLSGTACLVLTSRAWVLILFAGQGFEKYNLLPVVWPRQTYLSPGWSVVTSKSRLTPRLGFTTGQQQLKKVHLGQTQVTESIIYYNLWAMCQRGCIFSCTQHEITLYLQMKRNYDIKHVQWHRHYCGRLHRDFDSHRTPFLFFFSNSPKIWLTIFLDTYNYNKFWGFEI